MIGRKLAIVMVALAIVGAVFGFLHFRRATVVFTVEDAVTGSHVWNVNAVIGEKSLPLYFQSDSGPREQRITGLKTGIGILQITAPDYADFESEIRLRAGVNRVQGPVRMRGTQIPDLARFIAFPRVSGTDLMIELRPVTAEGEAIRNHPSLPVVIAAVVYEQIGEAESPVKGPQVYSGVIDWAWDATPESVYRYRGILRGLLDHTIQLPVAVDTMVAVPKHERSDAASLGRFLMGVTGAIDATMVDELRRSFDSDFEFYVAATAWNVRMRR